MLRFGVRVLAILAIIALFAPANARDRLDRGPKVGAAIPHPLAVKDQYGVTRDLPSLGGKRGLILLFTRSLDW